MPGDDKTLKILFFGDMVGKPGRNAVKEYLQSISPEDKPDFVIANVENASHGFGLTEKNYNELSSCGIDCMTSGNHIWDKKDIFNYIEQADKLLRPMNYPEGAKGFGSRIFECGEYKIGVINLLGRVFTTLVDDPFRLIQTEIERIKKITPIIIIDFHAEATAEKICFAKFCSELGASAVFGTHTHVQTADEKILNGTGYITDAGFCGTVDSVIGMEYKTSLSRFLTGIPERYEVAEGGECQINAVEVEISPSSGRAIAIRRIFCSRDKIEEDESQ
ncbi:TIGR00282 family metallophosphoesterase [Candidatus Gastranaerophilales bacterium]|nr:MAG: TIGR00282 family metallophosphoesterase [Candidatus Gastranaerophilales bacterium]